MWQMLLRWCLVCSGHVIVLVSALYMQVSGIRTHPSNAKTDGVSQNRVKAAKSPFQLLASPYHLCTYRR